LTSEAKSESKRITCALKGKGLLTRPDRAVLASYAQSRARFKQAERHLDVEGLTITCTGLYGSSEVPSPWIRIAKIY